MGADDRMILKDLPVDTRNYTIIDNISGKPIDQSNYTLTIDADVIKKLNQLKKINEEKIRQASLREQYGDSNLISTFTPENNAVFTPMYNDQYIDIRDYKEEKDTTPTQGAKETIFENSDVPTGEPVVTQSNSLLSRVKARDPLARQAAIEEEKATEEAQKVELDYISSYDPGYNSNLEGPPAEESAPAVDNSLFTPEMANLQQASEQIIKIDTSKLGPDIKPAKETRKESGIISLDKMEIILGRKVAWMAYILFFIPLLFKKNNRFVRIHANEGLELNIVEILGGILVGQYFILPSLIKTITTPAHWISLIGGVIGAGLIAACILSAVGMMIAALCGKNCQTPWLWKRRLIKVPHQRTDD